MPGGIVLPNPTQRFCLDLRREDTNWLRSSKVRKYMKDFTVRVKVDLKEDLKLCSR